MQKETIHEEKRHGLTIKIYQDPDHEVDRWGGTGLFLVGYHRDFSVDGPCVGSDGVATWKRGEGSPLVTEAQVNQLFAGRAACREEGDEYPDELAKKYHVFALEAYIHSGVRLSLVEDAAPFPDRRWDVSSVGAVFAAKKEWRTRKSAAKAARALVSEWNDSLSGNVYGYVIEDAQGEHVESCWGFVGDYDGKEWGALKEARDLVDHLTKKGTREHGGQQLFPFAATA